MRQLINVRILEGLLTFFNRNLIEICDNRREEIPAYLSREICIQSCTCFKNYKRRRILPLLKGILFLARFLSKIGNSINFISNFSEYSDSLGLIHGIQYFLINGQQWYLQFKSKL